MDTYLEKKVRFILSHSSCLMMFFYGVTIYVELSKLWLPGVAPNIHFHENKNSISLFALGGTVAECQPLTTRWVNQNSGTAIFMKEH